MSSSVINIKQDKKSYVKRFFKRNVGYISLLVLSAFCFNIQINMAAIVAKATADVLPYENACAAITMKMIDYGYSDSEIMDAMAKSECNPESFNEIKSLNVIKNLKKPKPDVLHTHKHSNYYEREFSKT